MRARGCGRLGYGNLCIAGRSNQRESFISLTRGATRRKCQGVADFGFIWESRPSLSLNCKTVQLLNAEEKNKYGMKR